MWSVSWNFKVEFLPKNSFAIKFKAYEEKCAACLDCQRPFSCSRSLSDLRVSYWSLTDLQLSLDPSFASFPKGHLSLIVLCHDINKLPGQNCVLEKKTEAEAKGVSIQKQPTKAAIHAPMSKNQGLFLSLNIKHPLHVKCDTRVSFMEG